MGAMYVYNRQCHNAMRPAAVFPIEVQLRLDPILQRYTTTDSTTNTTSTATSGATGEAAVEENGSGGQEEREEEEEGEDGGVAEGLLIQMD